MDTRKVKWVDDLSCIAALHLPSALVVDSRPDIPRPVPYRGRHGLRLHRESNTLQHELDLINIYAKNHKMSVNHQKTKVMLFARHKNFDFVPELQLLENKNIQLISMGRWTADIPASTASKSDFQISR